MTFEERLGRVLQLTLPKLAPDAKHELELLIKPASLEIMAGVLAAWIVGHAVGVGEFVDVVIGVVGVFSIGMAVFSGIDELFLFARRTWSATGEADLEDAADHLARAIAILGIQAVLALLFKGRPRPGSKPYGPEPPRTPGARYEPSTVVDPGRAAGEGGTTFWGDAKVSGRGTAEDQKLVLLHEKVHQFLSPKLYVLRRFRVENRYGSYFGTSLLRYLEEMAAETYAQFGVNGLSGIAEGVRFPIGSRYVYWFRGGGYNAAMRGAGVIPETASLLGTGALGEFTYEVWIDEAGARKATEADIPWIMP